MFQDIKRNKIKTGFIVSTFIVVITLILYFVCQYFEMGQYAIVFALGFSIISAWASYYNSDKIVLSLNKARPATHEEDQKLVNILDSLMASSGLPAKPKLYVVDSEQPNAFATGRDPQHAVICVTTALLDKLNYYEVDTDDDLRDITFSSTCEIEKIIRLIALDKDKFDKSKNLKLGIITIDLTNVIAPNGKQVYKGYFEKVRKVLKDNELCNI